MNRIYGYQCYREIVRAFVKSHDSSHRALATACQIHTSYFSRVMTGDAEFSAEQLFKICKAMELQEEDINFVLMLGELSRSSHHEHKQFLKQRIEAVQEEHLRLSQQLQGEMTRLGPEQIDLYFSDIRLAKVHMLLTVPRFRAYPQQIARRLGLSEHELQKLLERLHQLGLIRFHGGVIHHVEQSIHLDEHHPLSLQNHKNWRIDALHHLTSSERQPHDYHFSATFTCDADTKGRIKEIFKSAIVQAQSLVAACPRVEQAYVLTLDLY